MLKGDEVLRKPTAQLHASLTARVWQHSISAAGRAAACIRLLTTDVRKMLSYLRLAMGLLLTATG